VGEILVGGKPSLLRLPDPDLGNCNNRGWKNYVELAHRNPPDVIILDSAELLELCLSERKMSHQLKNLATDLNVPVLVQGPIRKNSNILRRDFDNFTDDQIRFTPTFVCDFHKNGKIFGKYYGLETFIATPQCGAGINIQYCDHNMAFV
jgi:hypothetical protein